MEPLGFDIIDPSEQIRGATIVDIWGESQQKWTDNVWSGHLRGFDFFYDHFYHLCGLLTAKKGQMPISFLTVKNVVLEDKNATMLVLAFPTFS